MVQYNFDYSLCVDLLFELFDVFPVWRFCDQRALIPVQALRSLEKFYV
jgi:hypothetical protein